MTDLQTQVRARTRFQHLTHVARCASTQVLASEDPTPGCGIYWADHQTAGRGRQGRVWLDRDAQDLAVTFRVQESGMTNPTHLAAAAPVAIVETLAPYTSDTRIKWPNDVQVGGKKISGVLIDTSGQPPHTFHVGIGINVNRTEFEPEIRDLATSLRLAAGRPIDREEVLLGLAESLSTLVGSLVAPDRLDALAARFGTKLGLLGHRVRAVTGHRTVIGVLTDINLDRALVDEASIPLAHLQQLTAVDPG